MNLYYNKSYIYKRLCRNISETKMEDFTFNKDCLNRVEQHNWIKNISQTKMEDFTFVELKNIAREEGLCGWSKFKKQDLYDFLISNNVDVTKYMCSKPSTSICEQKTILGKIDEKEIYRSLFGEPYTKKQDLVRQAKKLCIDINTPNGKPKTIKQLLEDIVLELGRGDEAAAKIPVCVSEKIEPKCLTNRSKKQDVVKRALELSIDINRPDGKPKTIKELLEDISLKLLVDSQIVQESPDISYQPSKECLKRLKKDVIKEALSLGIMITHSNGKAKTIKDLCTEIELMNTKQSTSINNVSVPKKNISECVQTPTGTIECKEEICVIANVCSTNDTTGETICAPVNVCAPADDTTTAATSAPMMSVGVTTEAQSADTTIVDTSAPMMNVGAPTYTTTAATNAPPSVYVKPTPIMVPIVTEAATGGALTRRTVDLKDIENVLTKISDPVTSENQNIIGVQETVFKALGLI